MTESGRSGHRQTPAERPRPTGDARTLPQAESNDNCHCSCHHSTSEDGLKEQRSPTAGGASTGPWLINPYVVDFAYHQPDAPSDSPSPSPRRSSRARNSVNAEVSPLSGIELTEALLNSRDSGPNTRRSSAPAALGINPWHPERAEPPSIAQVIYQDYAIALQELALAQEGPEFASESTEGPSRLHRDARSKSYPGSQSYSKLFELELSPIFEDSPVFGSGANCILFETEDSAGSEVIAKEIPEYDLVASESSDSSYGELIESRTFGCSKYEESSPRSSKQETSFGSGPYATKECSGEASESNEVPPSDDLNCEATEAKTWPVPSLMLTQPTPESTKSSSFLAHQCSIERIVEDEEVNCSSRKDDSHSMSRVLEEVDPTEQRNCSIAHSTWLDTVESSVNTSEVEGQSRFLGGVHVDEHGSIVHGPDAIGRPDLRDSTQRQTGLSRSATRDCTESVTASTHTKKRWSLISSLKSRNTTNRRSDGSGSSSIWTRLSAVVTSTNKKASTSSLAPSDGGVTLQRTPRLRSGRKDWHWC